MHHSCIIYNVFVVSVLSYVWQLSSPPPEALALEKMAVRKLFPGPGAWIQLADMWLLRDAWGSSPRLISIQHKARAAAVRVCAKEAPQFRLKHRELLTLLSQSDHDRTMRNWKEWYGSCFYSHLHSQYEKVKESNLSPTRLYIRLADGREDSPQAGTLQVGSIYL